MAEDKEEFTLLIKIEQVPKRFRYHGTYAECMDFLVEFLSQDKVKESESSIKITIEPRVIRQAVPCTLPTTGQQ